MNADEALERLAERFGILPSFRDLSGIQQYTSRETKLALLKANGIEIDTDATILEALRHYLAEDENRILAEEIVGQSGQITRVAAPEGCLWRVIGESEESIIAAGRSDGGIALPSLEPGIHDLIVEHGEKSQSVRLVIAPRSAPSLSDVAGRTRVWGINAALYGLHSARNPGLGDYEDLATAAEAVARRGADFLGINPVHALGWNSADVISPYSPSHRGFLNTAHIAVERIEPRADTSRQMISAFRQQSAADQGALIDYAAHRRQHHPLLKALFADFLQLGSADIKAAFNAYREEKGDALRRFALFESLSGAHGPDWRNWPGSIGDQGGCDRVSADEETFHAWLQWHCDLQLRAANQRARSAGMALGLYLDLAVGSRRDGAEAWCERESVAEGVSIGAPPDHLSPAGQNWNLAAYAPRKMAANKYRALRTILAQIMQHCGVLRIDHVLGLNRSFWIPDNGAPGGYILQPFDTLLAIVRMEAKRAGTVVIGEDLGLVPKGFRQTVARSGLYSYSVLQYEKDEKGLFSRPETLRPQSLACFGTHDTPTLQGYLKGRDIDWWRRLGWIDEHVREAAYRKRMAECGDLQALAEAGTAKSEGNGVTGIDDLGKAVHTMLARSPAAMVSAQLDDVFGQIEAQNMPGTIDEHPNWRRRCPIPVDDFGLDENLANVGQWMKKNGRANMTGEREEEST